MMNKIIPLTWPGLILLFGFPTVLNLIACKLLIPYLDSPGILPIEITYFISVGAVVLIPMFIGAIFLSGKEIGSFKLTDLFTRMRIKKISYRDLIWTIGTLILLIFSSFLIARILMPELGMDTTPYFFQNMPLNNKSFWILYIWPIFFFFNIFGEEFLWRGYIQPRQELLNRNWTWLVHGILWAFWHLPMGLD
jgi:membrane protease YdiL (CAAX protease family)